MTTRVTKTEEAFIHARWHRALDDLSTEPPGPIRDHIEQHDRAIVAARLASVEALADEWDAGLCRPACDCVGCYDLAESADRLRAVLGSDAHTEQKGTGE